MMLKYIRLQLRSSLYLVLRTKMLHWINFFSFHRVYYWERYIVLGAQFNLTNSTCLLQQDWLWRLRTTSNHIFFITNSGLLSPSWDSSCKSKVGNRAFKLLNNKIWHRTLLIYWWSSEGIQQDALWWRLRLIC